MLKPTVNKGVRYIYRQGFTLTEMVVAISVVAIVSAIMIPAIYAAREGFTSSGADTLISAALSSAKAIAAKEQKYAGVRFQCVPDPERPGEPGDQYIIFIIQDPSLQNISVSCFRAARGVAPLKLPVNQGVMDLTVNGAAIAGDTNIDEVKELWDTTSFSIVFSPSGRLVTHDVQVWNKDGKPAGNDTSGDTIFNTQHNVDVAKTAMFYQDDNAAGGLAMESSRISLLIYDKRDLKKQPTTARYSGYLGRLAVDERLYINPYTGTIIENASHRNSMK
jgi:prepilin-type N-terminal cleavage/methylation domain-containing protein